MSYTLPHSTIRMAASIAISVILHALMAWGLSPRVTEKIAWPSPVHIKMSLVASSRDVRDLAVIKSSEDAVKVAPKPHATGMTAPEKRTHAPATEPKTVQFDFSFDRYFAARELDVRAAQVNEVQLTYPKQAYEMRIAGKVTMRLFINEQGGIDMTSILAAFPPGVFEEAALTAARALQFSPAIKNSREVKSQKTIEVVFNPYERIAMP